MIERGIGITDIPRLECFDPISKSNLFSMNNITRHSLSDYLNIDLNNFLNKKVEQTDEIFARRMDIPIQMTYSVRRKLELQNRDKTPHTHTQLGIDIRVFILLHRLLPYVNNLRRHWLTKDIDEEIQIFSGRYDHNKYRFSEKPFNFVKGDR